MHIFFESLTGNFWSIRCSNNHTQSDELPYSFGVTLHIFSVTDKTQHRIKKCQTIALLLLHTRILSGYYHISDFSSLVSSFDQNITNMIYTHKPELDTEYVNILCTHKWSCDCWWLHGSVCETVHTYIHLYGENETVTNLMRISIQVRISHANIQIITVVI
jgi:hypothetical protein